MITVETTTANKNSASGETTMTPDLPGTSFYYIMLYTNFRVIFEIMHKEILITVETTAASTPSTSVVETTRTGVPFTSEKTAMTTDLSSIYFYCLILQNKIIFSMTYPDFGIS